MENASSKAPMTLGMERGRPIQLSTGRGLERGLVALGFKKLF